MAQKLRSTSLRPIQQQRGALYTNVMEARLAQTGIVNHDNRQQYMDTQEYVSDDQSLLYAKDSVDR